MHYTPIGIIHCTQQELYEAPRQGQANPTLQGTILLDQKILCAESVADLAGFERIWIIFHFHLAKASHKAKVLPPRGGLPRSILATRAPHRPNPIGISCVRLDAVAWPRLLISEHDLIDGTPVLDIKPYLPFADAFPEALCGWTQDLPPLDQCLIGLSPTAAEQLQWLDAHSQWPVRRLLFSSLASNPIPGHQRRIRALTDGSSEIAVKSYRARFMLNAAAAQIHILSLSSGYPAERLLDPQDSRWGDLAEHRLFQARFCT